MSDLSTRIKKLAAFENVPADKWVSDDEMRVRNSLISVQTLPARANGYVWGRNDENARLTPLLEALAECVELFPTFHDTCEDGFYSCPAAENAFPDQRGSCNCGADARIKALTALESALKRLESRDV